MLRSLYILSCWACLLSGSFAQQLCASGAASWTSWFNTQDPANHQGNDVEDVSLIRNLYDEAARCTTVLQMEHSIVNAALGNATTSPRTSISKDGVFCSGTPEVPCPNYQVRFCCLMSRQVLPSQCGRTFFPPNLLSSLRIVNGLEAVPHSFPWSVSLQYRGVHDCGGVIVDQRYILTAAHCLDYASDLSNYEARVGAHDRRSSGQLIPISRLILHPQYNPQRSTNDIGIVELAAPITFNQQIQPICLADQIVEPPLDTTAFIAGWGNTIYGMSSSASPVLRQARLRVVADCSMYPAYDRQTQLCATPNGPVDKDHGSCQGDSGGALLYSRNGRWYAGGVVSYATGCGRQAFPTVYTKTSAYIDWIRATVN